MNFQRLDFPCPAPEEAVKKLGISGGAGEKHPSGAKARSDFAALRHD
jgi:hypothetical protein